MKYGDIKERYIYYVDFDKVKKCEFDGNHQALVLKKNPDKETLIVVPLTTEPNGRKVHLGKIPSLPSNLRKNDSYAVCNQVRTVNHSRFNSIKDDSPERNRLEVPISDVLFEKVLHLCLNELIEALEIHEKIDIYHKLFSEVVVVDVINTAYKIKKLPRDTNKEDLRTLQRQLVNQLNRKVEFNNLLGDVDRKNGIGEIIQDCLDDTLFERISGKKVIMDKKLVDGSK